MTPEEWAKARMSLAVFLSGYARRLLDPQYDRLMDSEIGRKLRGMGSAQRHLMEAAMYGLMAWADGNFEANSAGKRLFKEVAWDFPSEVAKRLHKLPFDPPAPSAEELVRTLLREALDDLDDSTRAALVAWLHGLPPERRRALVARALEIPMKRLPDLAARESEARDRLLDLDTPGASKGSTRAEAGPSTLSKVTDSLNEATEFLREQRESRKGRRR
jgi:hypothetical protein